MALATVSISDVLSAPNLCGLIEQTANGLPQVFPKQFTAIHQKVHRDYGEWKTQIGARSVASTTAYGSASKDDQQVQVGVMTAKLLHSFRNVKLPVADFMNLLQMTDLTRQQMGMQEIARQVKFHTQKQNNLRITALSSAIFNGNIWLDKYGNLLPSSSGATITIPFNIPAGNQNQLNVLGSGNIVAASWATAGTDIESQVRNLRQASMLLTGYPIRYAFYGVNIPSYLTNNTSLQTYFSRASYPGGLYPNGVGPEFVYTGDLPPNLLGLTWLPSYMQYAVFGGDNGTASSLIGADEVVFTTDPDDSGWLQNMEGSYGVPSKFGPVAVEDLAGSIEERFGMFSYAEPCNNPTTATLYFGDTYLPAITNPNCLFQGKVANY